MREIRILNRARQVVQHRFVPQAVAHRFVPRATKWRVNREMQLLSRLVESGDGIVRLVYDNGVSPPTYGDLLLFAMVGRFLHHAGLGVRFTVVDGGTRRYDWSAFKGDEADRFVVEQEVLVKKLLGDKGNATNFIEKVEAVQSARGVDHTLFLSELMEGRAIYLFAPHLLAELTRTFGIGLDIWGLCPEKEDLHTAESRESEPPTVVWNVRKGVWSMHRDPDAGSVRRDFRDLCDRFTGWNIELLSTQRGIEYVTGIISQDEAYVQRLQSGTFKIQAVPGFSYAMDRVLQGQHYVQRLGGGLGAVAWFGQTSYTSILAQLPHFSGVARGDKIGPWARSGQHLVYRPRDADVVPLRQFIAKV